MPFRARSVGSICRKGITASFELPITPCNTYHLPCSHVDAGIIAENVCLFCASEGLATRLGGGANREALQSVLSLSDRKPVIFVQPVGCPHS
ncbi:nitroreductase family protein [Martelella sp. AMO21009]